LWPPHELTGSEKRQVIDAVTPKVIVDTDEKRQVIDAVTPKVVVDTDEKRQVIDAVTPKVVVDTNEKRLTGQAESIEDLRKRLVNLWPPHELTGSEKRQVIDAVTPMVGRARHVWTEIVKSSDDQGLRDRLLRYQKDVERPFLKCVLAYANGLIKRGEQLPDNVREYARLAEQSGYSPGSVSFKTARDRIQNLWERYEHIPFFGKCFPTYLDEVDEKLSEAIGLLESAISDLASDDDLVRRLDALSPLPAERPTEELPAPQDGFPCSKAELLRAFGKDETHTKYLDRLVEAGRLVLNPAPKPYVGTARYLVWFRDANEHRKIVESIDKNRRPR
jgi:hypothetical protein